MKNRKVILTLALLFASVVQGLAQTICTSNPNIDFELGNYSSWNYETGSCCPIVTSPSGQVPGRHMLTSGPGTDLYGGFPIVYPAPGNNYSFKLGNAITGAQAEKARYNVWVPPGASSYSLIYRYAMVMQDPGHAYADQPRFEVKGFDYTTGASIDCINATYVAGAPIPGIRHSPIDPGVLYRDWTTGTINLTGHAGHLVGLEFATGDCALGGHFGYAYLDLQCGLFGDTIIACCPNPAHLSGPNGFMSYTWYKLPNLSTPVASGQNVTVGCDEADYALVVVPYAGFGCPDTLHTSVRRKMPIAGTISCPHGRICAADPVSYACFVTGNNGPGTWSISGGGSDITIDPTGGWLTINPNMATPHTVTVYYTVSNPCGSDVATCSFRVYPNPQYTITNTPSMFVCSGDPFTLGVSFTYPYSTVSTGHSYSWSTGAITPSITDVKTTLWGMSYVYSVSVTNSWGCTTDAYGYENVDPAPYAGVIHCPGNFCAANELSYICWIEDNNAPGTWSLTGGGGDVTIDPTGGWLWVNPSTAVPRTVTVSYSVTNSCGTDVASCTFTVYPNPQFTITNTPSMFVCSGTPYTLAVSFTYPYSTVSTGNSYLWSTGAITPSITDVKTTYWGMSYIYHVKVTNSWGCSTEADGYENVDPGPYAGVVHCPHSFCAGDEVSYICWVDGNNIPGTWSLTGGGGDVTIDPAGGWLWVNPSTSVPRTVTVSYTVTNSCGTNVASCTFTVYPNPQFTVAGPTNACSGVPFTRSISFTSPYSTVSTTHSYAWSTGGAGPSMTDVRTTTSGISMIYSVTVTNSFGCSTSKNFDETIYPTPSAFIEGCPQPLCVGQSASVFGFSSGSSSGGTWSCSPSSVATLSSISPSTVVVTGVSGGTAVLTFTVTDPTSGCTGRATCVITVNPSPAAITGPSVVCAGQTITLSSTVPGGAWTSSNTAIATVANVGGNGVVTGVHAGVVTISYSIHGCFATYTVTVTTGPTPHMAKCVPHLCEGESDIVLGDPLYSSGYIETWTCTPPSGTIIMLSPFTGGANVTGVMAGAATITYTVTDPSTGCSGFDICVVNVDPAPPPLVGPSTICEGQTITLSGVPPGGVWLSSNPAVAKIAGPGIVVGMSGGTATIDYMIAGAKCASTLVVTVISKASACVQWGFDPGCGCFGFIFTGTAGATVNYEVFDCGGSSILTSSITLDAFGNGFIDIATLPKDACSLCINTIDYMGCSWKCDCTGLPGGDCCAKVGKHKGGREAQNGADVTAIQGRLTIIPNPTAGDFMLQGNVPATSSVNVTIVDMLGKTIYSEVVPVNNGQISRKISLTSDLANGIYLVKVSDGDYNEVLRFTLRR